MDSDSFGPWQGEEEGDTVQTGDITQIEVTGPEIDQDTREINSELAQYCEGFNRNGGIERDISEDTFHGTSNRVSLDAHVTHVTQGISNDTEDDISSIDKGPDSEEASSIGGSSTLEIVADSVNTATHSRQTSLAGTESSSVPTSPNSAKIRSIDTRFQTRLSSLSLPTPSNSSIVKRHLRNMSQLSNIDDLLDSPNLQLEAVRWTKLRKLSSQVYSDSAMITYGSPTVVLPSSNIAIGTNKGFVLVFDYHQNLLHALGQKQRVFEWGAVTALCVSSDQSFVGVGYAYGHITTWDLKSPQSPHAHISPLRTPPSFDDTVQQHHGHLEGASVIHLHFVGKRRTVLVSGDVKGMAFYHNSKRSFIGKTIKSVRLLGRYADGVKKKPTTIFGCAPRPLGTEVEKADTLCLVAILTPYMLAVVSALPHPRTHFKVSRDKGSMETMGLSGCLAWFPALKYTSGSSTKHAVPSRLAYCWSNVMRILEVTQTQTKLDGVELSFDNSRRYECDEAIVAVQWINRQLLGLVTITQRFLIVNEITMTVTATVDLLNKHIMHHDYFSRTMADQPLPVSDAYYNTVRTFKGRIFLMGKYEFVIGSLSSWADRLLDIMESGDHIGAVQLAISFYLGEEDLVSVGLPANTHERQEIVFKSLSDLVFASLTFEARQNGGSTCINDTTRDLFNVCLTAAVAVMDRQNLLAQMFEIVENVPKKRVFLEELASFIYDGDITYLPPKLFKELILFYATKLDKMDRLEDLICRLNTSTLDLDLTFSLCKQYHLKDTEIYTWNFALNDYVQPLRDFSELISTVTREKLNVDSIEAKQLTGLYPYLSYVLTGRIYPTGIRLQDKKRSFEAKCRIYHFLFSGAVKDDSDDGFKHIRNFIEYDTSAFFAAMNEVFEDSFLNEVDDYEIDRNNSEVSFGASMNRQFIVNFLLDFFLEQGYPNDMRIFLNIFIARNYSKYSQFIMLPGVALNNILNELSYVNKPFLREECELALYSLLSKYKPPDLDNLILTLYQVRFYSVLQFIYRGEKRYDKLLEATLKDDESLQSVAGGEKLMRTMDFCLTNTRKVDNATVKQRRAIKDLIAENFSRFITINCGYFVKLISRDANNLHDYLFKVEEPQLQLEYLKKLFEIASSSSFQSLPSLRLRHLYITLLARAGETGEISHLLTSLLTHKTDVDLPSVVDVLIETRSIDVLILLLLRHSRVSEAMIYLIDHVIRLNDEYSEFPDDVNVENIESELTRYTKIGLNICAQASQTRSPSLDQSENETLWIRLLDVLIDISQGQSEKQKRALFRRNLLQMALSSLLDSSGRANQVLSTIQHNAAVVRIFRSILSPSSAKLRSLGSVRPILNDLFAAYGYQHIMCTVAKEILDSDAYMRLMELVNERLRGWKVSRTGDCEGCGRKIVGVGIDAEWAYDQWEKKQKESSLLTSSAKSKGKRVVSDKEEQGNDILVVFKCEHTYHLSCLKRLGDSKLECIVCQGKEGKNVQ